MVDMDADLEDEDEGSRADESFLLCRLNGKRALTLTIFLYADEQSHFGRQWKPKTHPSFDRTMFTSRSLTRSWSSTFPLD